MKRRMDSHTYKLTWIIFTIYLTVTTWTQVEASQKPNVVLIVADDLGWNDVGFHGSTQIPTPHLDSLAHDGIILNNYYVQPICTPTRSTLMTGRVPIHTGLQHDVIVGAQKYGLDLNETIMPQYLKKLGYSTHMIGKWHLGYFAKEYTPTYRGFDSFYGHLQGAHDYWDHTFEYPTKGYPLKDCWGFDLWRNTELDKATFGQYNTELLNTEAVEVIEKHNNSQPLFLYLPYQGVHSGNPITPLEAPWKYMEKLQYIKHAGRRKLAGMVSAVDESIGHVVEALNSRGMMNNTIIIFTTDNGGPAAGFDRNFANNWPLRGVKGTLWEGGVRGAGFIWSKLLKKSRYSSKAMIHVSDWLPTILHAAGYTVSKGDSLSSLDGVNQWQTLSHDEESKRKEMILNIDPINHSEGIRVGDMKLIKGVDYAWDKWYPPEGVQTTPANSRWNNISVHTNSMMNTFTVNCGPVKYKACNLSSNRPCLFNITADPCEFNNLADSMPDVVKTLQVRIDMYRATMVAPRNKPTDPKGLPVYHQGAWVPWIDLCT